MRCFPLAWIALAACGPTPEVDVTSAPDRAAIWSAVLPAAGADSLAWGDFDGDGLAELAVGTQTSSQVRIYQGVPSGLAAAAGRTLVGPGPLFGVSLAAGDLDQDGFDDLLVTQGGGAGQVHWYRGTPLGLSESPAATVGDDAVTLGEQFGLRLVVGEWTGDAYPDVLIGAPASHRAHLYPGGPSPFAGRPLWSVQLDGGRFGDSLADLGDTDGDGLTEFAIGAPLDDRNGNDAGAVYLYVGGASPSLSPSSILTGRQSLGRFGASLASGDVDGNGRRDLVVGAPGVFLVPSLERRGAAQIWLSDGLPWRPEPDQVPRLTTLADRMAADEVGSKVYSGFDLDDDGRDEVLVVDRAGRAQLYAGTAEGTSLWPSWTSVGATVHAVGGDLVGDGTQEIAASGPGLSVVQVLAAPLASYDDDGDGGANGVDCRADDPDAFPGAPESCDAIDSDCDLDLVDGFVDADDDGTPDCIDTDVQQAFAWTGGLGGKSGTSLATGDFDGDTLSDLAVSAPTAAVDQVGEGLIAVWTGREPWPADPSWVVLGGQTNAHADAVASGDFNGDGLDDLLVGLASLGDGVARAYFGSPDGLAGAPAWSFVATAGLSGFGTTVAAGDVNGDGFDDAVIGAPDASTVRIHFGSVEGLSPTPDISQTQTGNFGGSLAIVGDVNGDGWTDLAVGAPLADGGNGRVWFFPGSGSGPTAPTTFPGTGAARYGARLAGGGDLDGDGYDDFVAAAPLALGGEGRVRVFRGGAPGPTEGATLRPPRGDSGFGSALAVGDVNADGYADLVAGAPGTSPGSTSVYLGTPVGLSLEATVTWDGAPTNLAFGSALALGDADGDAYLDIFASDPDNNLGPRTYLFPGLVDADGDGLRDGDEGRWGLSASSPDSDGDGVPDGEEWGEGPLPVDSDGDGVIDALDIDSDGDGVHDELDNCRLASNMLQEDADRDGRGDACDDTFDTGLPEDTCICFENEIDSATRGSVVVDDLAASSGFIDSFFGHFQRGRSNIFYDFDQDGDEDVFLGNPGDNGMILRNTLVETGELRFVLQQHLVAGHLTWAASASDYDNDGDLDLYLAGGGNECTDWDMLWENQVVPTGEFRFEDVTERAGIKGPILEGRAEPIALASGNGAWGDYDKDGDNDLFVATNTQTGCGNFPAWMARNVLWRNNGDGTFTDVTVAAGLHTSLRPSRHPSWVDIDNDNDLDLYEMNYTQPNVLWVNELIETGRPTFVDRTAELSSDADISRTNYSFAACAEDFDNDGWQDIIVFHRGGEECSTGEPVGGFPGSDIDDVVGAGHQLYLNRGGTSFREFALWAGLNTHPVDGRVGAMGTQIGDVNADGVLDVYFGNGGPIDGEEDQLFLSASLPGQPLWYEDATVLIDWPAPTSGVEVDYIPPYPYRTHGVAMLDVDNDGTLEIAVNNGGPSFRPDEVREPNRLFKFTWDEPRRWLKLHLEGDGVTVPRDAIGTRARLVGHLVDGSPFEIWRTVRAGQCFSALNGLDLYYGLTYATSIDRLEVFWLDGTSTVVTDLAFDSKVTVRR